jgi:hypothetical protein
VREISGRVLEIRHAAGRLLKRSPMGAKRADDKAKRGHAGNYVCVRLK